MMRVIRNLSFLLFLLFLNSCTGEKAGIKNDNNSSETMPVKQIDFQGHRGCRGLMPENTIPGFIKALDLGVNTLEMDVVITSDMQVLLSHEPYFSHEICTDPQGKELDEARTSNHLIYALTYAQTTAYDCGMKPHLRFPDQEKIPVHKPLLIDVILAAEQHANATQRELPYYNIETKSTPEGDNILHPAPDEFARLLADVVIEKGIQNRTIIQSFDVRTLQYLHNAEPDMTLALLVENNLGPEENLRLLGFTPDIYSPDYNLVDEDLVNYCAQHKMKLIPWTVNELPVMQNLLDIGVDGIISDYPDKFRELR